MDVGRVGEYAEYSVYRKEFRLLYFFFLLGSYSIRKICYLTITKGFLSPWWEKTSTYSPLEALGLCCRIPLN
jgi:hypothetical protein